MGFRSILWFWLPTPRLAFRLDHGKFRAAFFVASNELPLVVIWHCGTRLTPAVTGCPPFPLEVFI